MPEIKNPTEAIQAYQKDFAANQEVLARLGALIYMCAATESLLHLILRRISGTTDAKARILSKHIRTEIITKKIEALNTLS
jgi:hypothetical protein